MKILTQVITVGLILAIAVSFIEARCFSRSSCDLRINNNCYVHIDQIASWDKAESCCVEWGGHLASIHSEGENYLLNSIRNKDRHTWIGLNDKANEGTYVWTDGTSYNYNNFSRGQPDDYIRIEDCIHFWPKSVAAEMAWNDGHCPSRQWGYIRSSYICQKSMCPNLPKSKCDIVVNGKCYVFGEKNVDWHTAESCCKEWGGHLASIHSDLENYAVNSIRNKTHWTWIGLNDDVREGTFEWTDGTPHYYKRIRRGRPNSHGRQENCVDFSAGGGLDWNDRAGGFVAKSFVCKKDYICPANCR